MEKILGKLQLFKESSFRLASKVRWVLEKVKILELRGFLEPLKSSLQLLLTLMKNEIVENRQEPAVIRYSLHFRTRR